MSPGSSSGESNNTVRLGGKLITRQNIEKLYGKKREDAAAELKVSMSTFKRKCLVLGIKRWPYPKRELSSLNPKVDDDESALQPSHSSSHSSSKKKIAASTEESMSQPRQTEEETSTTSSHKIKSQEKVTDFKIRSNPNSISDHDVVDNPTHMRAHESISSIENTKLHFNKLIALPLKDLSNPENESSMKKALSILADNLTLFSVEKAEQILELSLELPTLVHRWRQYYDLSQKYSQKSLHETENIRYLVETSLKDEESLKVSYEELEKQEKELMTQLVAVQKKKAEIAEQRIEKSKHTKHLICLAEEKEAHRNKEQLLMRIATSHLNNLSDQWTKLTSSFASKHI